MTDRAPTPRPEDRPDQLTVCTRLCGARCCRYLTVSIDPPRGRADWDEVRWWLAHAGVMVTRDEDGWMLHVETRCRHLRADRTCGIYEQRMTTCSEYDPSSCEYTDDVDYDVDLQSESDLADYLERRDLKRGIEVARAIRRAEREAKDRPRPPLIPLIGLERGGRS